MSDLLLRQIARPARWSQARQTHPAVVQACVATFSDESSQETLWELSIYTSMGSVSLSVQVGIGKR